jgi:hypothetical protein
MLSRSRQSRSVAALYHAVTRRQQHCADLREQAALDGFNGTIFAYGQTGSGKTFSITGGTDCYADRGIIPRALSMLFNEFKRRSDFSYQAGRLPPTPSSPSPARPRPATLHRVAPLHRPVLPHKHSTGLVALNPLGRRPSQAGRAPRGFPRAAAAIAPAATPPLATLYPVARSGRADRATGGRVTGEGVAGGGAPPWLCR